MPEVSADAKLPELFRRHAFPFVNLPAAMGGSRSYRFSRAFPSVASRLGFT
jgi:hypothetical protein